ncbi:MAG: SusC/RagA family TonB-linked outer membrane protein, partial [Sphingobacteriaceae bacterium]
MNQLNILTGTVLDEKSTPLPGVVVRNTTTGKAASTDANGRFSISATEGDIISFTFIGYVTQSQTVGSQSNLSITLVPSNTTLKEVAVVAIGYGTQNKDQVASAVTHVDTASFRQSGARNPLDLIQGKVAGLQITRPGGTNPNTGVAVQLRGAVSVTGSTTPLFVIDGIPGGNLDLLQQDDIASIDVLKDGSGASIY